MRKIAWTVLGMLLGITISASLTACADSAKRSGSHVSRIDAGIGIADNSCGSPFGTAFDSGSIVTYDNAGGIDKYDLGYSITIDSKGRILVAGCSETNTGYLDMAIWRYNADGTLDITFDSDGIVTHNNAAGGNALDVGFSIMIDANEKILVTGESTPAVGNGDMAIWRFNKDGTLDTTFDSDGIVTHNGAAGGNNWDMANAVTTDSIGRILVAGYSSIIRQSRDMAIWRFNEDGSLDATFDSDGIVTHERSAGGSRFDEGYSITVDSKGRILVAGQSFPIAGQSDMVIWRFNEDGSLDATFDLDGIVNYSGIPGKLRASIGRSITIDPNGRILVAGHSAPDPGHIYMAIWRFNEDGSPDTTFYSDGIVTYRREDVIYSYTSGNSIMVDANWNIFVAGAISPDDGKSLDMAIWRYGGIRCNNRSIGP